MDVDRLTELAYNIISVTDVERRYKAVSNLQETILKDIGRLINDCKDVIESNKTLRFSDFQSEIYRMFGIYNVPYRCISLLIDNLNDIVEYENDTEEKRVERKQKLEEFAQVVSIQLPPKKVIQHMGTKCYTEVVRDVSPDLIYCQHGTYRMYNELCNTFYFVLCRKIQQSGTKGGLKELFQKVCLYIALNNEKAVMEDELLLLEDRCRTKKDLPSDIKMTDENDLPSELNTDKAKKILQKAVQTNLCDDSYTWKDSMQLLAYFADKMSHYLALTNKMDKDGNIQTSWKPFEAPFEYKGKVQGKAKLKGAKQNWMKNNTRFEPTGHEKIDTLFE